MTIGKIPRVLFVCLGNICRSPTAEAVFRCKAKAYNVAVDVDSAGTIGYHKGNLPDSRSLAAGESRGYSFSGISSRPVIPNDFYEFDYIFAMDKQNLNDLKAQCPRDANATLALFLSMAKNAVLEVPDPYYGGDSGFDNVLDLVEDASDALLSRLKQTSLHNLAE